jgi:hypothetical protein
MQRTLLALGLLCIVLAIAWPWLSRIGWGRLPGDIVIERGSTRIYIPLTTCLLVSLVASVFLWWWRR